MKRLASLIIACILLLMLSSTCNADSTFTLRNGIEFGDTIETIVEKETSLTRKGDTSTTFSGKIAGYNNSECAFSFDSNDKLKSMTYDFSNSCSSRDSTNDVYKKLYKGLVRQYGNAEGNTGGSCELITGPAIDSLAFWVYFMGELNGRSAGYYDYDEWIIEADTYYVRIDLVSFYYRDDDYDYSYFAKLSYYMYTEKEY